MALAAQADVLLREIRDLRAARQRQLESDLAEIDRDYESDLRRLRKAAVMRRRLLAAVASLSTIALACAFCLL